MTALDALLGTISKDGDELELGSGLNFTGPGATLARNAETGKIDITVSGSGGTGLSYATVRYAVTSHVADLDFFPVVQDGVTGLEGDAVLLAEVSGHPQNGIYTIGAVSGGAAPITRRSDFNTSAEVLPGVPVTVREGTLNAGVWYLKTGLPITINATALTFVKSAGSGGGTPPDEVSIVTSAGVQKRAPFTGVIAAALGSNVNAFTSGAVSGSLALNSDGALVDNTRIVLTDKPWGATTRNGTQIATCAAGSAIVTLNAAGDFQNGDSIVIPGAGGNPFLATPSAPIVQQYGAAGSRRRDYKVVMMTSEGGYSAPSPATTITNAPTTCTWTDGVNIFVPRDTTSGAKYALVYEQLDGAGNFVFIGVAGVNTHVDQRSNVYVPVVRKYTETSRVSRYGLPAVRVSTAGDKFCPSAGAANFHRARIIAGGGTTTLTLDLACATTITGAQIGHCNWLPFRDAQCSLGALTAQSGGEIILPRGLYPFCRDLHIDRTVWFHGVGAGANANAPTRALLLEGCGISQEGGKTAEKWCPAAYNRVGDRMMPLQPNGGLGIVLECTTAGYSATTQPTWSTTNGVTTADGTAVWTTRSSVSVAAGSCIENMCLTWTGVSFPANPHMACWRDPNNANPDLSNATNWAASTAYALGAFRRPLAAPNGFVYQCTTAGTSGASEPNWAAAGKLKHNATITDGTAVWTAIECRFCSGASIVMFATAHIKDVYIDNPFSTGVIVNGSGVEGTNCNRFQIENVHVIGNGVDVNATLGGGIVTQGQDTNAGLILKCNAISCLGPGFGEFSQIGNAWISCHAVSHNHVDIQPYYCYSNLATGAQSNTIFLNCYQEGGGPTLSQYEFCFPAQVIGGTFVLGAGGPHHDLGTFTRAQGNYARFSIENTGSSSVRWDDPLTLDGVLFEWPSGANNGPTVSTADGKCNIRSSWDGAAEFRRYHGSNSATGRLWSEVTQGAEGLGVAAPQYFLGASTSRRKIASRTPAELAAPADQTKTWGLQPGDLMLDAAGVSRLGWTANVKTGVGLTHTVSTSYYAGNKVKPAAPNGYVYSARNTGATGGTAPTWPTTVGNTVVDGTITWECYGTDNLTVASLQGVAHPSPAPGANLTDADATITWAQGAWRKLPSSTLSANRTLTLSVSGLTLQDRGIRLKISRFDISSFRCRITNGGAGAGSWDLRGGKQADIEFQFDGVDWTLCGFGELVNSPSLKPGPGLTDADVTRLVSDGAVFTLPEGTLTAAHIGTAGATGAATSQAQTWVIQKQSFSYTIKDDGTPTTLLTVAAGAAYIVYLKFNGTRFALDSFAEITS